MSKAIQSSFRIRYRDALLATTDQRKRAPMDIPALGRLAVASGVDRLALCQLHRGMVDRGPPSPPNRKHIRQTEFLGEMLRSIAQANRTAQLRDARVPALLHKLIRREVVIERLQLSRVRDRARWSAIRTGLDRNLEKTEALLADSRRLQKLSQRTTRRALLAQENERREISRDLHDGVVQTLAGINTHLAALKSAANIGNATFTERIAQAQHLVGESVQTIYRFARELRPAMLDDIGLIPALRAYIRDLIGGEALKISFTAFAGVEDLNNLRRTVIYRVVQESLTNIVRHAKASRVTITISKSEHGARLRISDNGQSFSVKKVLNSSNPSRLGIVGMKERVEMVGGSFAISSSPNRGTTILVEIPKRRKSKEA